MSANCASISLSGRTYAKLKAYAIKNNMSITSIVERAVIAETGLQPAEPRPYRRYRGKNVPGTP